LTEAGPETERTGGADAPADHERRPTRAERGKTVHGEPANAGHRILAPDDAEVEAYLEVALDAPPPLREEAPTSGEGPDTVLVLDFGSQYAQLIARRVRELNVYSELLPFDTPWAEIARRAPKAVILSGGPASVFEEGAPRPDRGLWTGGVPVLGICYGQHLMAHELGGEVVPDSHREYGPASIAVDGEDGIFHGLAREQPVWMSHGD
jgi:carbamoylphosphate synthase small subunit